MAKLRTAAVVTPETVAKGIIKENWLSELRDMKDDYEEIGENRR